MDSAEQQDADREAQSREALLREAEREAELAKDPRYVPAWIREGSKRVKVIRSV